MAMKLFDEKMIAIPVSQASRDGVYTFLSQHVVGTGLNTNQSIDKSVLDEIRALSDSFELAIDGGGLRCSYPPSVSKIWALLDRGTLSWPAVDNLDQTLIAIAVGNHDELQR